MRYTKWIGIGAVLLLVVTAFTPWVSIDDGRIIVSGIDATGTNFGKPAYMNFILSFFYLVFLYIPRIWAMRVNLSFAALNLAWGLRNFVVLSACSGGDCPVRQFGIYIMAFAVLLMFFCALFPDVKFPEEKK